MKKFDRQLKSKINNPSKVYEGFCCSKSSAIIAHKFDNAGNIENTFTGERDLNFKIAKN